MTGAQLAAEEAVATSEQQAQQANAPHHRHAHALEQPKPQLYEVLPARFTKGAAAENITLLCHARRPGQRPPGSVLRRAKRRPVPRANASGPRSPTAADPASPQSCTSSATERASTTLQVKGYAPQ